MNQEKALAILKSGRNVFLTGSAGSGKTHCLRQYIDYLQQRQVAVAITASTGIAATHLNGMTIHTWSGIGIRDSLSPAQLNALVQKPYLSKKLDKVQVLIIDEISMLHRRQFELVDRVLRCVKGNEVPFGGVQLVVCGDFFQLPPVGRDDERSAQSFCFMSPVWVAASLCVCYLSKQYRSGESRLNQLLQDIRRQQISSASQILIQEKLRECAELTDKHYPFPYLYPYNVDVDAVNLQALERISGRAQIFNAIKSGQPALADMLARHILVPETLTLKIGARVMFVKNNPEQHIFNGSLGDVIGFAQEGIPRVRLHDGREVYAEAQTWQITDEYGKTIASVEHIPLRLAWAITIHKSQGMTLDTATMDLSQAFAYGQGYVALSRLKNSEGLYLMGINDFALTLDPLARKADERFRALSAAHDAQYELAQLRNEWREFIVRSGGDPNPKTQTTSDADRRPSWQITQALVAEGHSLATIAALRGLKESTILAHLSMVQKHCPHTDFSTCITRNETLLAALEPLLATPQTKEEIGLKALYEALQMRYSYDEIKQALLLLK